MKFFLTSISLISFSTVSFSQNGNILKGLLPAIIDYRLYQSPVKDQAERGTCIAFSVAAVMENFDGVPADLSEQGAYGSIKFKEFGKNKISSGGLLAEYPEFLKTSGFMHESKMKYDPKAQLWTKDDNLLKQYLNEGQMGIADILKAGGTSRYGVEEGNSIFLKDNDAKDIVKIKKLLADGNKAIAVGYTQLYVPYWSSIKSNVITPNIGFSYTVGDKLYSFSIAKILNPKIVEDCIKGKAAIYKTDTTKDFGYYGGHAVTIIGYNDKGFIIKNSWGLDWGMKGYAVISYDYHRLFCDEALAILKPSVKSTTEAEINPSPEIYLKTVLTDIDNKKALRLSLFAPGADGLFQITSLNYQVYEQNPDGTRGNLIEMPFKSITSFSGNGFPVQVQKNKYATSVLLNKKYWIQIVYKTNADNMERIKTFPNVSFTTNEYAENNLIDLKELK